MPARSPARGTLLLARSGLGGPPAATPEPPITSMASPTRHPVIQSLLPCCCCRHTRLCGHLGSRTRPIEKSAPLGLCHQGRQTCQASSRRTGRLGTSSPFSTDEKAAARCWTAMVGNRGRSLMGNAGSFIEAPHQTARGSDRCRHETSPSTMASAQTVVRKPQARAQYYQCQVAMLSFFFSLSSAFYSVGRARDGRLAPGEGGTRWRSSSANAHSPAVVLPDQAPTGSCHHPCPPHFAGSRGNGPCLLSMATASSCSDGLISLHRCHVASTF